jgi:hypothetical protein
MKVFRLFKLEEMFFGVQSVDTIGRCTTTSYLFGRASMFVMLCWMGPKWPKTLKPESQLALKTVPESGDNLSFGSEFRWRQTFLFWEKQLVKPETYTYKNCLQHSSFLSTQVPIRRWTHLSHPSSNLRCNFSQAFKICPLWRENPQGAVQLIMNWMISDWTP